jgi:CubicO group peptidase (beta-lactamase class C family)
MNSGRSSGEILAARIARIERGLVPDAAGNGGPTDLEGRMRELHVPAVSVAVIHEFEIDWAKAYGAIARDSNEPATTETLFAVGSVTKMVTAVAALLLVDRGELDLDRDINDYLYSWKLPASELSRIEKVTLRRLLTHTSGLPSSAFDVEESGVPTTAQVLRGESPAINEAARVQSVPGSQHAYSNVAYVAIQQIIEDLTGQPFPEVVRETVLHPLGMLSSTFDPLGEGVARAVLSAPHDATGAQHPIIYHPTAVAQGGLWSTPTELARLLLELMNTLIHEETGILSPWMVREMLRPQPPLDIAQYGWTDGQGLGVFTLGTGENLRFLHPGLSVPGATGLAFAWPAKGFGVTLATNGFNGHTLQLEVIRSIAAEYGLETGL